MDTSTKVAAGLLLATLSLLQSANAAQATPGTEVLHAFDRGQRLVPAQSAIGVENQTPKGELFLIEYRRGVGRKARNSLWHFHEDCQSFPTQTFAIRKDKPSDDDLCARCDGYAARLRQVTRSGL